jgi:hypothetical protein
MGRESSFSEAQTAPENTWAASFGFILLAAVASRVVPRARSGCA